MELRSKLASQFGILFLLEAFKMPPCKPPTGKEVLERPHGIMKNQEGNKVSVKQASLQVSHELINLWTLGDTRISLVCSKSVQKKIMKLYEVFAFVRLESRKHKKAYASKVSTVTCRITSMPLNFDCHITSIFFVKIPCSIFFYIF